MKWETCNQCGAEVLSAYMDEHERWHAGDIDAPCQYCECFECECELENQAYDRYVDDRLTDEYDALHPAED